MAGGEVLNLACGPVDAGGVSNPAVVEIAVCRQRITELKN